MTQQDKKELLNLLEFLSNPDLSLEERTKTLQFCKDLVRKDVDYFKITSVHREDLQGIGFITDDVDDATMEHLASKLSDDYCEQMYWQSLEIIAGDYFNIPKFSDLVEKLNGFATDFLEECIDGDDRSRANAFLDTFKDVSNADDLEEHRDRLQSALMGMLKIIHEYQDPETREEYEKLLLLVSNHLTDRWYAV